nr:PEP-utilizing enzyme [Buchananella hordeovulneris]
MSGYRWLAGKGRTLQRLAPLMKTVKIDPGYVITRQGWAENALAVIDTETLDHLAGGPILVRSSAHDEDTATGSKAGRYNSLLLPARSLPEEIECAVETIFAEYIPQHQEDEVFLQRYISNVAATAVVATSVPATGAPYLTVAIDESQGGTDGVTSGSGQIVTWYILEDVDLHHPPKRQLSKISHANARYFVAAAQEILDVLTAFSGVPPQVEMEMLLDNIGRVHLLQVRPLILPQIAPVPEINDVAREAASLVRSTILTLQQVFCARKQPVLLSNTTDWNPAEMIGQRPHTLAYSLYSHAITDRTWARQRAECGYRDLQGTALMHSVAGQPYVDVGASLESFIPAALSQDVSARLLSSQLQMLAANKHLHRSVEFTVASSCLDFSLPRRFKAGPPSVLSAGERHELWLALVKITASIVQNLSVHSRARQAGELRRRAIAEIADPSARFTALVSEVIEGAALPFAHLARGAFVATAFLRSSVEEGLSSPESITGFMNGLHTITSQIRADGHAVHEGRLSWVEFIRKYAHLRPGTYDLREMRYEDDPESFLRPFVVSQPSESKNDIIRDLGHWFTVRPITVTGRLNDLGLALTSEELVRFTKAAIEERELAKFEYSAWISDAMEALYLARPPGTSREDLIHWTVDDALRWCAGGSDPSTEHIESRRHAQLVTSRVHLPSVFSIQEDLTCFAEPPGTPTYVGTGRVTGAAQHNPLPNNPLTGIVVLDQADPGWEWLFSRSVLGVVTAQGGANSHLAVRCAELGIPAVIGIGEDAMRRLRSASVLMLDCLNRRLEVVR